MWPVCVQQKRLCLARFRYVKLGMYVTCVRAGEEAMFS